MKYIMLEFTDKKTGLVREYPFIFPEDFVHVEVATVIACLKTDNQEVVPVSAGFLASMDLLDVDFHGESESIGVESRPEDGQAISMIDYTHGIV